MVVLWRLYGIFINFHTIHTCIALCIDADGSAIWNDEFIFGDLVPSFLLSLPFCLLTEHESVFSTAYIWGRRPENLCLEMLGHHKSFRLRKVQDFLVKNGKEHLDDKDNYERTVLMFACMQGNVKTVRFFLDEGADPNKQCKDLSTSLHYACRPRWDGHNQLRIIRELVRHGAKMTPDIHGWTPMYYAALHNRSDIVEYFLTNSKEELSTSNKILALEILAFARSVLEDDHIQAYNAILRAIKFREECGTLITPSIDSGELELCLGAQECKTVDEIQVMGAGEEKQIFHLKKQGFLIGARVLPDAVKEICFWPVLSSYFNHESTQSHLRTCGYILKLESQLRVTIGTALHGMTDLVDLCRLFHGSLPITRLLRSDYNLYHSNLECYREILQKVSFGKDLDKASRIFSDLGKIIISVIGDLSGEEICAATIRTIADLVGILSTCLPYFNHQSITGRILCFYEQIPSDELEREGQNITKMLQLAFLLLIEHEYSSRVTRGSQDVKGSTMLHYFCWSLENFDFLDVIIPVVRKLIRYGVSVAQKGDFEEGFMNALDLAEERRDSIRDGIQKYDELIALLKEELESVLSLQELAARVVLQNRIPYRGIVPKPIHDIIEGDDLTNNNI